MQRPDERSFSWSGNAADVILDMATAVTHGLVLTGSNLVEGFVVDNFDGADVAIQIDGADTTIQSCDFPMLAGAGSIRVSATATPSILLVKPVWMAY